MNTRIHIMNLSKTWIATSVAGLLEASATAPNEPADAAEVNTKITRLQSAMKSVENDLQLE